MNTDKGFTCHFEFVPCFNGPDRNLPALYEAGWVPCLKTDADLFRNDVTEPHWEKHAGWFLVMDSRR